MDYYLGGLSSYTESCGRTKKHPCYLFLFSSIWYKINLIADFMKLLKKINLIIEENKWLLIFLFFIAIVYELFVINHSILVLTRYMDFDIIDNAIGGVEVQMEHLNRAFSTYSLLH